MPLHEPENRQDQLSGKAEARLRLMNFIGFRYLVGGGCTMNGRFSLGGKDQRQVRDWIDRNVRFLRFAE